METQSTETTKNIKDINPKKELLIKLSNLVCPLVESGDFDTVNEAVIETFYKKDEHQEFATLFGWREKGFKVKKGSISFPVWSKPLKGKKKEGENAPVQESKENEKTYKFFSLAHLFSNAQVEPFKA